MKKYSYEKKEILMVKSMRILLCIMSLLLTFGLTGCGSDDESALSDGNELLGKWELEVSNQAADETCSYKEGDVVVAFSNDKRVSMRVNSTDECLAPLVGTGTYSYEVLPGGKVVINGVSFDYHFKNGKLCLDCNLACGGKVNLIFHKLR